MTIKTSDPTHKDFIEEINNKDYMIRTDKLPPGESIACMDDPDMLVIKEEDGTVLLNKKCFRKTCFIR